MKAVSQGFDYADRVDITFTCESGHDFVKVFAADADLPSSWDCPRCGAIATRDSNTATQEEAVNNKTHWDMVLERRSTKELNEMLKVSLERLRTQDSFHP